jgi:hypothetical protein
MFQKDDCEWCVDMDLECGNHGIFQGGVVGCSLED